MSGTSKLFDDIDRRYGEKIKTMSEEQKMLVGLPYLANTEHLIRARVKARRLQTEYNKTQPTSALDNADAAMAEGQTVMSEDRKRLLSDLLELPIDRVAKVEIEPPLWVDYGTNIKPEGAFYANYNTTILDCSEVRLGDGVLFGPNERKEGLERSLPVNIGKDTWVGGGTIIMAGVTIGRGCTIGAGSVVTKNIPDWSVAAGSPCKVMRMLTEEGRATGTVSSEQASPLLLVPKHAQLKSPPQRNGISTSSVPRLAAAAAMTTPTPAGSSATAIGMTTPSPLAMLSSTTPRGTSIALSSLQALPETQLVLVLLDHPTVRRKWRSVVVPLVESISKKLNTTYSGSRPTIGCVVYRSTLDKSLLRPSWTLSRTKLQPGSKLIASNLQSPEPWLGPERPDLSNDADTSASIYSLIDARSATKPTAHVLEAFVAALELLQPSDNGVHNPLAPKKSPVLARHMLHVCLDSSDVSLDLSSPPFFNADAANDRATAPIIGARLARLGVSITSCAVKPDPSDTTVTSSREALTAIIGLHKIVVEPNKLANEDLAALLPEAVRAKIFHEANIVSSGLTPGSGAKTSAAALPATAASTKRSREDETDAVNTSVKRSKSGSISQPQPPHPAANASNVSTSAPGGGGAPGEMPRNIKLDPTISTKVHFLRSQQETMIKNWAAAYSLVAKSEAAGETIPNKPPGMNKAYLEQLKAQLMTQQHALKMLVQRIVSGAETAPNFNVSLQSLINIDKEAKEMGVNLGGPFNGGTALAKPGRSGSLVGGQQPSLPLQQGVQGQNGVTVPSASAAPTNDAVVSSTANNATTAAAGMQPPSSPTRPKPFWRGALTWSVIADPVTKQKCDVATLVSATSNSPALDRLMMPWPDNLQITAITQLAPRNLQVYAQSQNAPYILFSAQEADSSGGAGGPVLTPAKAEKNRQMYSNLASSLDAKKSCAYIRHGSNAGAGLVLFATTQPTSSAERSAKGPVPPKLIGVVLKDTIPFTKMLSAQNNGAQPSASQKATTPQGQDQGRTRGVSAAGSMPDSNQAAAATAVQQPPQQVQQQGATGMGLGSSMPFNLAALNAAGNVPVSGLGATAVAAASANEIGEYAQLGEFGQPG
ncbi:hypothetical protein [Sporisorium scitamineum]|uniref:Maltose/galactoside acetyltransferase domain-containing protein n=1 Tax=Sporisorium scitamineum TaxID=49012 RepID=A0A0F7SCN5_9BASI|nr:hypothetical protein [Sporisorium scitamineum]